MDVDGTKESAGAGVAGKARNGMVRVVTHLAQKIHTGSERKGIIANFNIDEALHPGRGRACVEK